MQLVNEWDNFYLVLARQVAQKSKDPSTKTGAVIVRHDNTVASIGFNGFPQAMPDVTELYNNREEKYSRIIHCEMNAVLFARQDLSGSTLYTWPFASCDRCMVHMIQAGIRRFVAPKLSGDEATRWAASLEKTRTYARECNVELVEYDFA